jgi:hypothetical protein
VQDKLKDLEKLRNDLFILSESSKASSLIQPVTNTYITDSHIIAYKAQVNTEIFRIEKQVNLLDKDDPKRMVIKKYQLLYLKRIQIEL